MCLPVPGEAPAVTPRDALIPRLGFRIELRAFTIQEFVTCRAEKKGLLALIARG